MPAPPTSAPPAARTFAGIIDYEHRGDAIVDEIHELLDNAFILRFDISDCMRLTDDLDNVIDGMRKVAIHIDIYKPVVGDAAARRARAVRHRRAHDGRRARARRHAVRAAGCRCARVREMARTDRRGGSGGRPVSSRPPSAGWWPSTARQSANRLEFIAWDKLYQLLEQMTDEANHCGKLILSLARKEA